LGCSTNFRVYVGTIKKIKGEIDMKEVIKSIATNVGIGIPLFTILYFSNPTLMNSLNDMEIFSLGLGFVICKDLVVWGLKK
jgi:hypothetical protein